METWHVLIIVIILMFLFGFGPLSMIFIIPVLAFALWLVGGKGKIGMGEAYRMTVAAQE